MLSDSNVSTSFINISEKSKLFSPWYSETCATNIFMVPKYFC
jgi:hypothetical protein